MDSRTLALAAAAVAGKARNAVQTRDSSEQASGGDVAFPGAAAAAMVENEARARRRRRRRRGGIAAG
jgi:hypothetical protein